MLSHVHFNKKYKNRTEIDKYIYRYKEINHKNEDSITKKKEKKLC